MNAAEIARASRARSHPGEVRPRGVGTRSAAGAASRPITPAGYRVGSQAWRHHRRLLRRTVARCDAGAVLAAVVTVGAFGGDRPIAGVLGAFLAFGLLRAAAETRAEL